MFLITIFLKQKRNAVVPQKGLKLIKVVAPCIIGHLFCYGAKCSHPCFLVQQQPDNYKAETSEVSSRTKSHVSNFLASKGKKTLFGKADFFKRQNFALSPYQTCNFAAFNMGW